MIQGRIQRVASAVAVMLAMLAIPGPALAQAGGRCWDLPPGSQEIAHRYWFELFQTAREKLQKIEKDAGRGSVNPDDVDEVILMLRILIKEKPASQVSVRTLLGVMDYVPYFHLSSALVHAGDYIGAEECLDKDRSLVTQAPKTRDRVASLDARINAGVMNQQFVEQLAEWKSWAAGDIRACLTEPDRPTRLVDLAAGGGSMEQRRKDFISGVTSMAREEAVRLGGRLRDLESAGWASAVSREVLGDGAAACREPAAAATLEHAEAARRGLESCCATAERAMRGSGAGACAELNRLRAAVRDKRNALGRYSSAAASPSALPALPDTCGDGTGWNTRDFAALWAAIDDLAYPDARGSFQSELDTAGSRLSQAQQGFKDSLRDALGAIVRAERTCAGQLQLGNSNDTLAALESRIESAIADANLVPTPELNAARTQIDDARSTLQARAGQGADRLFLSREIDPDIDQAAFAGLPGARDGFKSAPSQSNLDALCAAAAKASGAVAQYWAVNLPKLRKNLTGTRWLLGAAAARATPDSADRLACIQEGLDTLPKEIPSGNTAAAAVENARNVISAAQACLTDYHARRQEWASGIRLELRNLAATLDRVPASGQVLIGERVAAMRADLTRAAASLEGIATLLDDAGLVDEATLRRAIDSSGLTVADRRWTELGALGSADAAEGLLAVRDEAVDGTLVGTAAVISSVRPLAGKLGVFVALSGAFERYGSGDLDGAIESLRGFASEPAAASDRSAAIRHAAMSYFLHTKWSMLAADSRVGPVGELLLADATLEARAARRMQQGLVLPAILQRGVAFKSFFEGFSSE